MSAPSAWDRLQAAQPSTPVPRKREGGTRSRAPRRPAQQVLTIDQLAEYLQVSKRTIYRLIDTKQLPHLRIGYVLRFDLPAVLAWADLLTSRLGALERGSERPS